MLPPRGFHFTVCFAALLVIPSAATAHQASRLLLDPDPLDSGGLYLEVHHPRVIRGDSDFGVSVTVENLLGESDALVTAVRYGVVDLEGEISITVERDAAHTLPSKRIAYTQYLANEKRLEAAVKVRNRRAVDRSLRERARILAELSRDVFVDRHRFSPASARRGQLDLRIAVEVVQDGASRVLRRTVQIPRQPALPRGGPSDLQQRYDVGSGVYSDQAFSADRVILGGDPWFSGDQHLHTRYSIDAFFLDRTTENVADYAAAADASGLDWITVTDHSNIDFTLGPLAWYTSEQFELGTADAAAYTASHDFLALYGEEMGAGQSFVLGMPSHLLAYPSSVDSTGFLENPCSRYIFNLAFCEDHQVIIDRVNDAGGMSFIAHPTNRNLLYAPWNFAKGAVGWAGMEIWTGSKGDSDQTANAKWHELLGDLRRPRDGELFNRPGFPSLFPVAIGNSDAHTMNKIGATFTYAQMPSATRAHVSDSLLAGRAVASNGPLLFGHINGAGLGEVATDVDAGTSVDVTLQTTPEFGPVGDYTITVNVDGAARVVVPPSGSPAFSTTISIDGVDLGLPDKFVTLEASSMDDSFHAFTNPIWLSFPTCEGDVNDDLEVDLLDLIEVLSNQGPCNQCPADVTQDGVVDGLDLIRVIQNRGDCLD